MSLHVVSRTHEACRTVRVWCSPAQVDVIFKVFDVNESGTLEEEEFLELLCHRYPTPQERKLSQPSRLPIYRTKTRCQDRHCASVHACRLWGASVSSTEVHLSRGGLPGTG